MPALHGIYVYIEVLLLCFNNKRHGRSNDWTSIGVRTHSLHAWRGRCVSAAGWEIEDNKNVTSVTRRRLFTFALSRKNCVNLLLLIGNKHVRLGCTHHCKCICMHQAEAILRTRWGRKNCTCAVSGVIANKFYLAGQWISQMARLIESRNYKVPRVGKKEPF